jgi:cytochrome oxidase Cu insertion factor (SCO1/SenC/PrrC family)
VTDFATIPLVADDGTSTTIGALKDRWVVLFFGYMTCPDVCPMSLAYAARELKRLGPKADAVHVAFISVDPGRDSPLKLAAYVNHFDERFTAYTGVESDLRELGKQFGVYFEYGQPSESGAGYLVAHTGSFFVLDPQGRLVDTLSQPHENGQLFAALDRRIASRVPPLTVTNARINLPPPGATTAAAYFDVVNNAGTPLTLTSATVDGAAMTELHRSAMDSKGMMTMERVLGIDVEPGKSESLVPGGLHVMIMGLKRELRAGETVKMTIGLKDGRTQVVEATVTAM